MRNEIMMSWFVSVKRLVELVYRNLCNGRMGCVVV